MKKISFKKIIGQLHLWLGLASGLVVFVVAITGAIWAFESEISDIIHDYRTVKVENKSPLPPTKLKQSASKYFAGKPIQSIDYQGNNRSVMLRHWSESNGKEERIIAYLNPYSGEVLHVQTNHDFFDVIIELHVNLMMGDIGRYIVDFATLFFLILLISGIVLWWPKNKAAVKQRYKFDWKINTKWKRKNYDLHNILGFYASWVAIFISITGLAWGFEWVNKSIYFTATLGAEYKEYLEPKSLSNPNQVIANDLEDRIYHQSIERYGKPFETLSMYQADKPNGAYAVYINDSRKTYYDADSYFFDKRTGQFIAEELFEKMNNGQKARSMYYDIHIGKIWGLPGQFLVFFASLIVASLPITGFYIWWGRRSKEKKSGFKVKKQNEQVNHVC
ncbi:MAG: PepSY domain-containing protein [Spirosomaceae bacterium]|jgi:uncharacterized iron-regulated membrane protein|nr:PepSY domain-containing protein [Spirosomataceae bacterium]